VKTPAILQAFKNDILPAGAQLLQVDDPVAIGGHRLTGRLRSGGAGIVYLARDRAAGLVTIKTTHPGTTEPDPVRTRLRAEAACVRRLPPACTARLMRDGTDQTPPFLVAEHVEGPSLERIVDVEGSLPSPVVTALAADLAQALAAIHGAGVVHGNLTPANVLVTKDGLRVTDFGVAEEASGEPAEIGALADNPGWLAPELLTGAAPDRRCDIFGWGCVVTYAATGHSPYPPPATGEPTRVQPVDTGVLDAPLRRLVDASVSEDPVVRPTADDLVTRLEAITGTDPEPLPDTQPVPLPGERPHAVRGPHRPRARSALSLLATLAALFIALPAATERVSGTPPPSAAGPAPTATGPAPPSEPPASPARPRPPRSSNSAAISLYGQPPPVPRRARPAPKADPRPSRTPLWMSCASTRTGWCSLPGGKFATPTPRPSGWDDLWETAP
jgi:eukaryotic-like serine/threonine-protein kinase